MEEGDPPGSASNTFDEGKEVEKEEEEEEEEETKNAAQVSQGLGAVLANITGGNRGSKEDGQSRKPPFPRANVSRQHPQGNLGFDLNSVEEFSCWGDLSTRADATSEPLNTSRGNGQRRTRFSREVPRQHPQENLGFDLNSVTEFTGWGDLTSGSGANTEPLNAQRMNNFDRGEGNPDAAEQPEEPKPSRPVRDEPNTRGEGRPGRKPGPPPRGLLMPPAVYGRDKERESRSDRDRPGFKRAEPYGRDHRRFEQGSQGFRNQNDQRRFGRRENQRGDRRPFNNPHNDRRTNRGDTNRPTASRFEHRNPPPFNARAPPPATPAPQENFSGGPTGALVKRLSDCSVKSADDAKLATEVISLLLKSLKEFQQKKGDTNSVLLLQEAEVKFNIMKALQSTTQTGSVDSNPVHVQNESRPPYSPGHVQNEPRPMFNPGHMQDEPRPTYNPGHLHNERRPLFNPGHRQDEPPPTFNPGHVQNEPRSRFNPGHMQNEPRSRFNPGHLQNEPRSRFNPGHVQNEPQPPFNPGHVQDEPRPPYNQVQRFPAQNFYPPPAGPGYQMDNGQAHYSAPPLRYNK